MKIKIMTLFLLTPFISYSQKEDNIWLIGRNFEPDSLDATSVIDFRESPPLMDLVYEFPGFYETNANISDPDGNLLFYTNGVHLYNAAYNLVENGGAFQSPTLYPGGYVFIQGALIFPYPGHPGQYMFILCDDTNYTKNNGFIIHGCYPITYSVIESNGNGGTVTSKKIPFSSDTLHFNQLQGIKHANGRDWWLVSAPFFGINRFNKFLLSPEGIAPYDADYFNGALF